MSSKFSQIKKKKTEFLKIQEKQKKLRLRNKQQNRDSRKQLAFNFREKKLEFCAVPKPVKMPLASVVQLTGHFVWELLLPIFFAKLYNQQIRASAGKKKRKSDLRVKQNLSL